MRGTYARDESHASLLLSGTKQDTYERKMLLANRVPDFLQVKWRQSEEGSVYEYDISAAVSLHEYLGHTPLTCEVCRQLIYTVCRSDRTLKGYLLPFGGVRLEPELIFLVQNDPLKFMLCYYPDEIQDSLTEIQNLIKYLMENIDEKDEACAELCCQLYGLSQKENFCLPEFVTLLEREDPVPGGQKVKRRSGRDNGTEGERIRKISGNAAEERKDGYRMEDRVHRFRFPRRAGSGKRTVKG